MTSPLTCLFGLVNINSALPRAIDYFLRPGGLVTFGKLFMNDLAPHIFRQRLVIEGVASETISAEDIEKYLSNLSNELDMVELLSPVTHRSDTYGWAGWIHWETSGAHFYAWEDPNFFSVDIYTCKQFSPEHAVAFTKSFFTASVIESRDL